MPKAPESAAKGRIEAFDAYRGMAIVLVVFAHCAGLGWEYQHVEGGALNFGWSVAIRNLALCSLPMFLFVSGWLLGKVRCATWGEYGSYLSKRVSRVAIPYLVWSVFFIALGALRDRSLDPVQAVWIILTGQADGPYYFILMMIQFYLLAPLLTRALDWRHGMLAMFLLHIAWVCGLYSAQLYWMPDLHFAVVKTPFLSWLSIFTFGMYVRRNPGSFDQYPPAVLIPLCVALYAAAIGETYFFLGFDRFELAISDIRFTTLAFAFAVILLALRMKDRPYPAFWQTLGAYSFGIFFVHGIVLRTCHKLLGTLLPGLMDIQPVYQSAIALATLAICVTGIYIARRMLPENVWSRLLGF
ncbi:MAG: acyltransferase family protein [Candidatus Hydrogenedens sp.]|nr:acyltransferase family protein [Candidatus Hydrogenedens sp.]